MAKGPYNGAKLLDGSRYSSADVARFYSRVRIAPTTGCWEFSGKDGVRAKGYRSYKTWGKGGNATSNILAHRVSYAMTWGSCPAMFLLHARDNPCCVNPQHLTPGTNRQNTDEMISRGRG